MSRLPHAVLFVCNHNHVRSPMAAALMRQLHGREVFVESCGMVPRPADSPADPFAATVMGEVGLDIADHAPKTFDELEDEAFDLIIALTPEAHGRALEMTRGHSAKVEYWTTADPTLDGERSRDSTLAAYRQVRDVLTQQLRSRFGAIDGAPVNAL